METIEGTQTATQRPPSEIVAIQSFVNEKVKAEQRDHPRVLNQESQMTSEQILSALKSNEDGDAWLFNEIHQEQLVYDHAADLWCVWTGHYWRPDLRNVAMEGINAVIDLYGQEADRQAWLVTKAEKAKQKEKAEEHENLRDALLKRIRALQSATRKRNILFLATVGRGLTGEEWDRDPWILGCENGVVDLKTGEFREGRQADYIKTIAPVEWLGIDEPCPTWEQFLFGSFDGERDVVLYIQRLLGYAIAGLRCEHVIPVLWGAGRNGKGTLLETLKYVLGSLAHRTKAEILLDNGRFKSSGSADADTLALKGKRLVWASETNQGNRLNAGRVKELVGGDTLNARAPYGRRPIEFEPTHLLLLITNSKPRVPANDYALWQRMSLIPFTLSFIDNPTKKNERRADKELQEKLNAEASGILAWLVKGCLDWQKEGLNPPDAVRSATSQYQKEQDLISQFFDDQCVVEPSAMVKAGQLYEAYKSWCQDMGHKPFSGTRFGLDVKERFDSTRKKGGVFYLGIGLACQDEEGCRV